MKRPVVLDSFALVSLFHKESGWKKVKEVLYDLSSSGEKADLCLINWGEFYYIVKRRVGQRKAEEALLLLQQLPIRLISVDDGLVKEAADVKSEYPVSYADAFCIAIALRSNGQILTNDPEFQSVEHMIHVTWLENRG